MSAASNPAPFAARAIIVIIVLAVTGFVSYLLLSAYAQDFRPVRNGGAHALSTSAVGFSGVVKLLGDARGEVQLSRNDRDLQTEGLVILTPAPETSPGQIKAILDKREDFPTLLVLPKWRVGRLFTRPAWVQTDGKWEGLITTRPLEGIVEARIVDRGPGELRSIQGAGLTTVQETPDGRPLLVRIGDTEHYILADPDVISNQGLATVEGAQRAVDLLDLIAIEQRPIAFDLTLMGLGKNPNLLKLAFEAPFLPLTLCLLFAALLAGLHAMWRFGPAAAEGRKVAFGKRALAENGAALLRLAKRRHRTGGRYAMLTREAAAAASGAPSGLTGEALDKYLDRLTQDGEPFTSIAARAEDAPDTRRLLKAARDLYQWRRTVTREH